MSETLAAPIIDPSELGPDDLDAVREHEIRIEGEVDRYLIIADTENARNNVIESLEKQAIADPRHFLAMRERLSKLAEIEAPSDSEMEEEQVLQDVIDGSFRGREINKNGRFKAPTPEVRIRVERAIAAVRDAESSEGKVARRASKNNTIAALTNAYNHAQGTLAAARTTPNTSPQQLADLAERVRIARKTLDYQSGGTGYTEREISEVDNRIAELKDDGAKDDDRRIQAALRHRAELVEDYESISRRLESAPGTARERLRKLLSEHPEGIDVVHQLANVHHGFASNQETQENLAKAQQKLDEARQARRAHEHDPASAELALAQIAEFKAQKAYDEAAKHHATDSGNANFLSQLAEENAIEKLVEAEQTKIFGATLVEITDKAIGALHEWEYNKKPLSEHGSFVAIKTLEAYVSTLDERIALAKDDDRRLPHLQHLRDNAFDSYLNVLYHKEFVRTKIYAEVGDLEGRHPFSHTGDKGIVLQRENGEFIIYPDGTYCSVYYEGDEPKVTPRVNAYGQKVTTPILEQISDPRAVVDAGSVLAWEAMAKEDLKAVESAIYNSWISDPSNVMARAELEVISDVLAQRIVAESDDPYPLLMELIYMNGYLAIGREGNPNRLDPYGNVDTHTTLFGIEGRWLIHPNGSADLYTPGVEAPVSRYSAEGLALNAYGPETNPASPTPEDETDDGSGGGTGGTPAATPSSPAPTPPARPTPSPANMPPRRVHTSPEAGLAGAGDEAPKTPSAKERAARETRERAVKAAKNHTIVTTAIVPSRGSGPVLGKFEQGKSETSITGLATFGDGASPSTLGRTREQLWSEADASRLDVSPETFYIGPASTLESGRPQRVTMPDGSQETLLRVQYRFDAERAGIKYPAAGDSSVPVANTLVVDAELPQSVVSAMLDAIEQNPGTVRDFARDLYAENIENGAEIWDGQGGRPPYDNLSPDWKLSVIVPGQNGNGPEVKNYDIRR